MSESKLAMAYAMRRRAVGNPKSVSQPKEPGKMFHVEHPIKSKSVVEAIMAKRKPPEPRTDNELEAAALDDDGFDFLGDDYGEEPMAEEAPAAPRDRTEMIRAAIEKARGQ